MEEEENNTAKEESTKKMEEASDLTDEETATKKMEGEENGTEKEETTTKEMEEAGGLIKEETTIKKTGKANESREEDTVRKTTEDEEIDPKEEETANKMEEERNPEKKMEAESEPSMANVISRKENMKGTMIVKDESESSRIRKFRKFKRMQFGSSSTHQPSSDEVIQEQRPVKIHEMQESSKPDEEISMVMLSLSESDAPQPECNEGMGVADLPRSKLPQLEVDRDEIRAEDGPRRWRPPEKGWLKMNVEGLISEHLIATSVVIRNCNGLFLAAISGTFDLVTHVDTVKLLALRNALLWVKNGGGGKYDYLVELNSEQVVKHLRDFAGVYRMLPDEAMEILDECLELETHFQRMQFANVSAEENRVAHCLASRALHHGCEGEWFAFDAPDWLQEAISEDLPNTL